MNYKDVQWLRVETTTCWFSSLTSNLLYYPVSWPNHGTIDALGKKVNPYEHWEMVLWDHGNHSNFGPLVSPFKRMVSSHSPDGAAGLSLTHCLDDPTSSALCMHSVARVAGTALPRRSFVVSHRRVNTAILNYHSSHLYLHPSLELLLPFDLILHDLTRIGVGVLVSCMSN